MGNLSRFMSLALILGGAFQACSEDIEPASDMGRDLTADRGSTPEQAILPDQSMPDVELKPDLAPAVEPSQFVGSWEFLRTVCHDSDTITFVDYQFILQLQEDRGTSLDTTTECTLTTTDFPITKTPAGYELAYGGATGLSCTPDPCTLVIKTKVGDQVTDDSYACPEDFPVEGMQEVITKVEGTTLTTQLVGLPCESLYQKGI